MLATMTFRSQRWHGRRPRRTPDLVGITSVPGLVEGPGGRRRLTFTVDSGAVYTVLPGRVWRALGLEPTRAAEFSLADGTTIRRGIAEARFRIAGCTATSPVVCGEDRDAALLGAVTLETLGFMLNPLTREVLPMRLLLG